MSLILDGAEAAPAERIWNIYYHFYLDEDDMSLLAAQAKKLLGLSESWDAWHDGVYGSVVRFCDHDTFSLVRKVLSQYVTAFENKGTASYRNQFESARKAADTFKDKAWGKFGIIITAAKASAPLYTTMGVELHKAIHRCWESGLSRPQPQGASLSPNPMFAVAISETSPLAFPCTPLLSFNLAVAYANLTELSPSRPVTRTQDRILDTAQYLFGEWIDSFREASSRMVVRFVAADCFSLCQTLQHNAETGAATANWYRRESGFQALTLVDSDYGKGGKAPKSFDIIDSSNISDHSGALNLLISAGPLLKDEPWSTIYTELMARGSASESDKFESLLAGHTRTVSVLLGLAPIEYWTNATAISIVDEMYISMSERSGTESLRIQSRLAWKHDKYLSGRGHQAGKLSLKPADLAVLAHRVYLDMFQHENLANYRVGKMPSMQFPKYHRGTFAAFIKALCKSTRINASEFGHLILEKVVDDTTLALGTNHTQAFLAELSQIGVFSIPTLRNEIKRNSTEAGFCKWKKIPEMIAVTLVVPAPQWQRLYKSARSKLGSLGFEASVRCDTSDDGGYHNLFADVQIAFGIASTRGARDQDGFTVIVQEDEAGWAGNSPMIATFYAVTGALQFNLAGTKVSLCLQHSAQTVMQYSGLLDSDMAVFGAPILDEKSVYISKNAPGQPSYHIVGGSQALPSPMQNLSIGNSSSGATFSADIDAITGDITTITGHLDITTDQGKKLLADKIPIELQQSSPFTIDVVFGKRTLVLPLTFSVPVSKDSSKTRIARKSCYIEVIAPVTAPIASKYLEDYIFPTVPSLPPHIPVTLNIPHLNLDNLPILDISKKEPLRFLNSFCSFIFSARERRMRDEINSSTNSGIGDSARLNFKESLFTMLMLSSGMQGGQTGLFSITHPRDGIHMLIFVSALRLDAIGAGVVLDAAVLPFTREMIDKHELDDFLLLLRTLECATIKVDDAELRLWKRVLPALAERCRTWTHGEECEYRSGGGKIPVSEDDGKQLLCSCGQGELPEDFMPLPDWDSAAQFATRVAISPMFASPFVEDIMDASLAAKFPRMGMDADANAGSSSSAGSSTSPALPVQSEDACRACGRADAKPNGGPLKKCARCLEVKYCSAECQKKDWKKHRMECQESEAHEGR